MRFILEQKVINDIPVIEVYKENMTNKSPIVILLHGFNASKEFNLLEAYKFAKEGYFAVSFDAYDHGDLMNDSLKSLSFWDKSLKIPEIVFRTTDILNKLIMSYERSDYGDFRRVGLLGFSMGGSIIYNYICDLHQAKIKAAIPICSSPIWGEMFRRFYQNSPEPAIYGNEENIKTLSVNEPYLRIRKVKDLPLLMINGNNDYIVPVEELKKVYEEIRKNYSKSEMIKYKLFEGVGHQVTLEMLDTAIEWFKQYL